MSSLVYRSVYYLVYGFTYLLQFCGNFEAVTLMSLELFSTMNITDANVDQNTVFGTVLAQSVLKRNGVMDVYAAVHRIDPASMPFPIL